MAMNLHLLRVLAAVVEQQGFSRAAETLHVSQSAVSKAVRELEHQLELPLLERGRGQRGVHLTEHGQALYEHARGIFAMERLAAEEARDRLALRKGRLRIGASTTIAGYWLPRALAIFAARHPGLDIALVVGNTRESGQALLDCEVDVAFVEGEVRDERIRSVLWQREPLRLVVAAASPLASQRRVTAASLARHTWLLREQGSGTRQAAEALLAEHHLTPRHLLPRGSNEAIARAATHGAGIALLPAAVVEDLLADGRLRALRPGGVNPSRPLYRLELHNRARSPALQAFHDTQRELAAGEAAGRAARPRKA
jgi:DNA-binding transcriptional LysR family regulator